MIVRSNFWTLKYRFHFKSSPFYFQLQSQFFYPCLVFDQVNAPDAFWNCCINFRILSWLLFRSLSRLRFSSCLMYDFFCKANIKQLINAPTTAPKAMLRYVLDAFVISAQSFVISDMNPQIAIALIIMQ